MEKTDAEPDLTSWLEGMLQLAKGPTQLEPSKWKNVRLFLSSSFIDTHAERDIIVERIIPSLNRKLAPKLIRVIGVDLRWGVLAAESKDCEAIQRTCLNQLEKCKDQVDETPWFLGLRTSRYGWVQTQYERSDMFNRPEHYHWLDSLNEIEKHVSITSLECMHATIVPAVKTQKLTVFFYKRNIRNRDNIEPNLRWVFDFEYKSEGEEVGEDVKLQYVKTAQAARYEKDRNQLDKFLQNHHNDNLTYRHYDCSYEKGGAEITGENTSTGKKFAIGKVTGLEDFEKQVENDLYEALTSNFIPADLSGIPPHELKNIPYENSMKEKAASFVGRGDLVRKCYEFCSNKNVEGNVLIIHGEPGCGKSALTATVSVKCLTELRKNKHFVFVHAVDSCPDSSSIVSMLRRLHVNLQEFSNEVSGPEEEREEKVSMETPSELKKHHINELQRTAGKHPDHLFVVVIDAVNQFSTVLQSHAVWWLPIQNSPPNLRIVISTLNKENNTFDNACKVCPNAQKLPIGQMSSEDAEWMVSAILAEYNKKLTTTDDRFLGNQMELLLQKNMNPLYLSATAQGLRTFGVYEKLSEYIRSLPDTVVELFNFLLDRWVNSYGEGFVRDVCCIITLSKDGILENVLNDVLSFIENERGVDYECTFSRMYDSLQGFLAAGGGGHLRFFHDQLNKVVRKKFLATPDVEHRFHSVLARYYLGEILPQLCEAPAVLPPAYYLDCLSQVVHHQMKTIEAQTDDGDIFTHTLRDIHFISERVKNAQQDALLQEYLNVLEICTNANERTALKSWKTFVTRYLPLMVKYTGSLSAYNVAMQQNPSSPVVADTKRHSPPVPHNGFPLVWDNIPTTEEVDRVVLRYNNMWCTSCTVNESGSRVVVGCGEKKAYLYEGDSGVLIHEVDTYEQVYAVHISTQCNTFWTGDGEGYVCVFSMDTGDKLWESKFDGCVEWIGVVGTHVVAGTRTGNTGNVIFFEDAITESKQYSWETGRRTECYAHLKGRMEIATGFRGGCVKLWDVNGTSTKIINVGKDVEFLCPHPTDDDVLAVGFYSSVTVINVTTENTMFTLPDVQGQILEYSPTGDKLLTCTKDRKTVLVYGTDGVLQNKLKGHTADLRTISFVGGTGELVTAGIDGSMLFTIPTSPDPVVEGADDGNEFVQNCGMLYGDEEFFTLVTGERKDTGILQVWSVSSLQCSRSVEVEGVIAYGCGAVAHPSKQLIVVYTMDLLLINAVTLQTLSTVSVGEDEYIMDVKISTHGQCVVSVDRDYVAYVFNITQTSKDDLSYELVRDEVTYTMDRYFQFVDIHRDGVHVVSCGAGSMDLWNIKTGEIIATLYKKEGKAVQSMKFAYTPSHDAVVYLAANADDDRFNIHMATMDGTHVRAFQSKVLDMYGYCAITPIHNGEQLLTPENDHAVCIHDIATGDVLYTFVDHRCTDWTCFLEVPSAKCIIAYNRNGKRYILKSTQEI